MPPWLTPTPALPGPGGTGGVGTGSGAGGSTGGGIDPGGIINQLPEGTGPVATVIVVVLLFLASLVPLAAKFIPDRKATTAPPTPGGPEGLTRADADQLQTSYARLDSDLREAKEALRVATADLAALRLRYEASTEHNHDLELQLAAAHQRLQVAEDRLRSLEAQLALVLRPLHADRMPPAPVAPSLAGPRPLGGGAPYREPRRRDPHSDDTPTDPIREARR